MTAIIGWREWVALPDLGVGAVKAKIDTGARSSSLHAWDVEEIDGGDGPARVRFVLHPAQRDLSPTVVAEAPIATVTMPAVAVTSVAAVSVAMAVTQSTDRHGGKADDA